MIVRYFEHHLSSDVGEASALELLPKEATTHTSDYLKKSTITGSRVLTAESAQEAWWLTGRVACSRPIRRGASRRPCLLCISISTSQLVLIIYDNQDADPSQTDCRRRSYPAVYTRTEEYHFRNKRRQIHTVEELITTTPSCPKRH